MCRFLKAFKSVPIYTPLVNIYCSKEIHSRTDAGRHMTRKEVEVHILVEIIKIV